MVLKVLETNLSVCKLKDCGEIDRTATPLFLGVTDQEISLVCPTESVPANAMDREDGWCAFRVEGVLDFSLVGILSKISAVLADAGVGIFAVSTYNTDYILVKAASWNRASAALSAAGYEVVA